MKARLKLATTTSAVAIALMKVAAAHAGEEAVVALPEAVDMNVSAWSIDRTAPAVFQNVIWQGRQAIDIGIAPPPAGSSFDNWQGYQQRLNTPAGASSLSGDIWINSSWSTGTATDYVRTSIWGSALPAGSTSYVDSKAVFPIISFTNQGGVGRLEVWDTSASASGWVDLAGSSSTLNFNSWNSFETRILPGSDTIEYYVNGIKVYTWEMPRGDDGNISNQLWAVYLNPRNNGVTTYDTYWSNIVQSQLITDGGTVTSAPTGLEIVDGAIGGVTIADGVTVTGSVTTGKNSAATLTFGTGSGVLTTDAGQAGVISDQGSVATIIGGSVNTSGSAAHGLLATGTGSGIVTNGTTIAVTGSDSYGASATDSGSIQIHGGSVSSITRTLSADGGSITATDAALSNMVSAGNMSETGAVYAVRGGSANISGGSITLGGGRNSGLFAAVGGAITASDVAISASGDRVRGAYASADSNGAGSVTVEGGSIGTNGLLSHGLFAKRQSGSTGTNLASINAADVNIIAAGNQANGVYADAGGMITVNGGTVATHGSGGVGLHAQTADDDQIGGGTLSATNVAVTTSGASATGGFAERGGQLTLNGGSVTTTGAGAHGLMAQDAGSSISSSADVTTSSDWTFAAYAHDGGTINLTGGTLTTNGVRSHGLLAETAGTIDSSANIVTNGDQAHGAQAGISSVPAAIGAANIVFSGGSITTNGNASYGLLAYNGSSITGNVDITTWGSGSFGASADGDGTISLTGGSITTHGTGANGLQAVYDARFVNAGVLSATVDVTTIGAGAFGVLASDLGQVTLIGNIITTNGSAAHGIVVATTPTPAGTVSTVTATDVSLITNASDAVGLAALGSGRISFTRGSIDSAGTAIAASLAAGGLADFRFSGTTVSSGSGVLLAVDRSASGGGDGIVSFSLSGSAKATGDITDLGGKASGYTDVTLSGTGTQLTGGIEGVRQLSLSDGGRWVATSNSTIGEINLAGGTGEISVTATVAVSHSGTVTGSGNLLKTGSGTLALSGNSAAYAGTTTINDGTLLLTGTLGGNVVTNNTGVFQLGNGGTSGQFQGNLTNNGTFIFDRSDDYDFTGNMSGSGSLVKQGDGTLTLSGTYTYAGRTTVEGGRIQLAGNASLPETSDVGATNGGTLDLTGTQQTVQSVTASAGGTVEAQGATLNTQTLSADSGGMINAQNSTVSAQTVAANNGSTLNAQNATVNAQTLAVGTNSTANLQNATVTTTQATTLAPGSTTNLSGATLNTPALSSTSVSGSAAPVIATSQTTNIILGSASAGGNSGITVFTGAISGAGTVTQDGAGDQKLNGDSPNFTGTYQSNNGKISVNGDSSNATLVANSGGTVAGSGTVMSLMVNAGGNVATGNSIGTLHVVHDVTLAAGSVMQVEVNPSGQSDQIIAGGIAHIGGAQVMVLPAAGKYALSTRYTIIEAAGGIDGKFAGLGIANDFAFLTPTLSYEANDVILTLAQKTVDLRAIASTPNQQAVAGGLMGAGPGTSIYDSLVVSMLSSDQARAAFDQLGGELHATTGTFLVDQSRRIGTMVLDRLEQADLATQALASGGSAAQQTRGGAAATWGQAFGSWNNLKSDGNASSATQNQYGIIIGLDAALGAWRLGGAFSYGEGKVRTGTSDGSSNIKSTTAAVYAGGGWGKLRVHLGASYGWYRLDSKRSVSFADISDNLSSDYDGRTASAFGELSYAARLGKTLVEPFAGMNYVHLKTDGFNEVGGNTALSVDGRTRNVEFSTLGLRLGTDFAVSQQAVITPRLSVAWQHGFGDVAAEGIDHLTGQTFAIQGLPVARNAVAIDAGVQASIMPGGSLGVSYTGNIADRWSDHGIRFGFTYRF